MPLMRYFTVVGGVLLALLLVVNACLPALPVTQASRSAATDLSVIRIHSDTKWPERVVFDTTRPTITPAPVTVVAEAPPAPGKAAATSSKGAVREAFAQLPANPGRLEPKRKRKSVARNYTGPPRILVAQQRPVFFLATTMSGERAIGGVV
jgi:hypothetical protein